MIFIPMYVIGKWEPKYKVKMKIAGNQRAAAAR